MYWVFEGGIDAVRQPLMRSGLLAHGSTTMFSGPPRRPAMPPSTGEAPMRVPAFLNHCHQLHHALPELEPARLWRRQKQGRRTCAAAAA
jgi:hypothetical protein